MTIRDQPALTKKQIEILSKIESVVNTLSLRIAALEQEIVKLRARNVSHQNELSRLRHLVGKK